MYKRLPYLFVACTNHIHKPPSSSLLHQPFVLPPPLRHISRSSLNHPMSSSTANIDAPAPYTGTLRYPLDALITLARSIVKAKEDHHIALRDAANAANDEDEESEQSYDLDDVDHCIYAVDGQRWKARAISEGRVPGKGWDSLALQHFEDPRASEKGLFRMYGKAARVNSLLLSSYSTNSFIYPYLRLLKKPFNFARIRVEMHHLMISGGARKMRYSTY